MNPEEYDRMFELEDHYWWFVGRRTLALRLLRKWNQGKRVLDLGCGTGAVLKEISTWGEPVGLDRSELALRYAKERFGSRLVLGDGTALPFASAEFDACVVLDVFEHIEDDIAAMGECARVLKPGGVLVLSVPAFKSLFGPHDVALHHFRRYRRSEVTERLRSVGLEPVKASYGVFFLFPLVVLSRWLDKFRRGPAEARLPKVPDWLNRFLIGLCRFESSVIEAVSLPWGSSVVAVARKPLP